MASESDGNPAAAVDEKMTVIVPLLKNGNNATASGTGNGHQHSGEDVHHSAHREDFSCGLCGFHPPWWQRFATKQSFLVLFCLISVIQGMYYTYFVSVVTTLEKLFQIQSKTTGIIMSATEIGQIGGALLLSYYGGQGHRPRWIASGMILFAFASILCSLPHYLFSTHHHHLTNTAASHSRRAFNETISSGPQDSLTTLLADLSDGFCRSNDSLAPATCDPATIELSALTKVALPVAASRAEVTNAVLSIFFASLLMIGIGSTAVNTLGIPYIDDNVAPKESPLYFAITIGVRIFGPVLGFVLGSLCTNVPVDFPFTDPLAPQLSPTDPQWVGAWWLGVTVVGISLIVAALPMMAFPRKLPRPDPSSYCHQKQQAQRSHRKNQNGGGGGDSESGKCLMNGVPVYPIAQQPTSTAASDRVPVFSNQRTEIVSEEKSVSGSGRPGRGTIRRQIAIELDSPIRSPAPPKSPIVTFDLPPLSSASSSTAVDSRKTSQISASSPDGRPKLKDFPTAMKRLLTNDVLLCRAASSVLHILPIAGLYTFLPKYLEHQFQLTASDANLISGIAGILVMGVGIFASGSFMRKFKPSARFTAVWIALAALAYSVGMVLLMVVGCPLGPTVGLEHTHSDFAVDSLFRSRLSDLGLIHGDRASVGGGSGCASQCSCFTGQFNPVCGADGVTYLSPCLAGCSNATLSTDSSSFSSRTSEYEYTNCSCVGNSMGWEVGTARKGTCRQECDSLFWYIVIFSTFVLIHSTCEVGSMLLTLRCVAPEDKAMALGLISFAIGLFGNVPCPIIYGLVVDSACLYWEEIRDVGDSCDGTSVSSEKGACRVYDPVQFRITFHGLTALIMFVAFVVDAIVVYKAGAIQVHEDEEESVKKEEKEDGEEMKSILPPENVNS